MHHCVQYPIMVDIALALQCSWQTLAKPFVVSKTPQQFNMLSIAVHPPALCFKIMCLLSRSWRHLNICLLHQHHHGQKTCILPIWQQVPALLWPPCRSTLARSNPKLHRCLFYKISCQWHTMYHQQSCLDCNNDQWMQRTVSRIAHKALAVGSPRQLHEMHAYKGPRKSCGTKNFTWPLGHGSPACWSAPCSCLGAFLSLSCLGVVLSNKSTFGSFNKHLVMACMFPNVMTASALNVTPCCIVKDFSISSSKSGVYFLSLSAMQFRLGHFLFQMHSTRINDVFDFQ